MMSRNAMRSVADIAPTVPGLNVNSDSVGRAFVSIRGIGTALQAGVQPGIGNILGAPRNVGVRVQYEF